MAPIVVTAKALENWRNESNLGYDFFKENLFETIQRMLEKSVWMPIRVLSVMMSEKAPKSPEQVEVDEAVDQLIDGLPNELYDKGRKQGEENPNNYIDEGGNAQNGLDSLPGGMGENGQKNLIDGGVAGIHTSTRTGETTLHIHRPTGSRDIKIRYR